MLIRSVQEITVCKGATIVSVSKCIQYVLVALSFHKIGDYVFLW